MSGVSSELLRLLVCPVTKGELNYNEGTNELISEEAGLAFPVRDGIPILLVDQARKITNKNFIYENRVVTNENQVDTTNNSKKKVKEKIA